MDNQEKDFLDDTEVETSFRKPKKQWSEQKLQHLQNIRVKALEKKKEMKVITEKANKLKEIESLKEMKKVQETSKRTTSKKIWWNDWKTKNKRR